MSARPEVKKRRAAYMWALVAGAVMLGGSGCGSGGSSGSTGTPPGGTPTPTPTPVNNTLAIAVNAGPTNNDVNELLTTVTICVPGTTSCQSIPNVLVDTGSTGLRLIASTVSLNLPRLSDGTGSPIGNCAMFASNTYAWGPVATADIQLAGEVASSVPIQLINASGFAAVPSACSAGGTNTDVNSLGANGILGVQFFRQDCGSGCAAAGSGLPPVYFGCPGSGCVAEAVSLQQQIQNPVWLFPQDNNGFVISLPSVGSTGSSTASGSLIFGIGTQSNNGLSGVQVYGVDGNGNFTVTFNGNSYSSSFIDSGSNGYFLLNSKTLGLPLCTVSTSFYCPTATASYTAVTQGTNGTASTISFSIGNADQLFNSGNTAFDNIGGPNVGGIDLGLPFFFGRPVYVVIEQQSISAGTGPLWAF